MKIKLKLVVAASAVSDPVPGLRHAFERASAEGATTVRSVGDLGVSLGANAARREEVLERSEGTDPPSLGRNSNG